MLIYSGTGVTSIADQRAEKPISHVGIVVSGNTTGAELITIRKIGSGGGVLDIITQCTLIDLLEINAQEEGLFIFATGADLKGVIKLAEGGAGKLGNDEYIDIKMSGMTAGATYSIYGLEHPLEVQRFQRYMPVLQTTAVKQYDVRDMEALAIVKTNFTEAVITYKNGKSVIVTPAEIELHSFNANDLVTANASKVPTIAGFLNLYVFDLIDATDCQIAITSGQTAQVYLIDTK